MWTAIAATFIISTGIGLLVRLVECRLNLRNKCNFVEILWKMTRLQLMQSEEIRYILSSGMTLFLNMNLDLGRISLLTFRIVQMCIILNLLQVKFFNCFYATLISGSNTDQRI